MNTYRTSFGRLGFWFVCFFKLTNQQKWIFIYWQCQDQGMPMTNATVHAVICYIKQRKIFKVW